MIEEVIGILESLYGIKVIDIRPLPGSEVIQVIFLNQDHYICLNNTMTRVVHLHFGANEKPRHVDLSLTELGPYFTEIKEYGIGT